MIAMQSRGNELARGIHTSIEMQARPDRLTTTNHREARITTPPEGSVTSFPAQDAITPLHLYIANSTLLLMSHTELLKNR